MDNNQKTEFQKLREEFSNIMFQATVDKATCRKQELEEIRMKLKKCIAAEKWEEKNDKYKGKWKINYIKP